MTVYIGQAKVTPLELVGQLLVINTEQVHDPIEQAHDERLKIFVGLWSPTIRSIFSNPIKLS